jgi:moderate conductance mechanosensitive channel
MLLHWLALARQVTWDSFWSWFTGVPLQIILTIAAALVVRWLLHRLIDRVVATTTSESARRLAAAQGRAGRALAEATGIAHERYVQRTRTMGAVLRSAVTLIVAVVAALTVMALLEIPLGPLLASAGIGGVALGFGAQSLVKDYLSGIFMTIEDQFGVGDVVDTGGVVGTVEDVSLRVTRLRDGDGVVWYVRNGEILRVGNKSQGWSLATVDVPLPDEEDVEHVMAVLTDAVHGLSADETWAPRLLDEPTVARVEAVGGAVTVRVSTRCAPAENPALQRALRERVSAAFEAAGMKDMVRSEGPMEDERLPR